MRKKLDRRLAGILRILLVASVVIIQILIVVLLVFALRENVVILYFAIQVIAVVNVFFLVGGYQNTSYTTAWVLLILLLPVTGQLLYLLWGRSRKHERVRQSIARGEQFLQKDPEVYRRLGEEHPWRKRLGGYLGRMGFPLYQNTRCDYYALGDDQFPAMLRDIEGAERFVFLEYFIVDEGELWQQFKSVLVRKAAQGVDVRLLYDDFGSIVTAPEGLIEELEGLGIQVRRFNPIHRYISRLYINYRNHQKICVVDGNVGYTGGTNLADEYANYYAKLGHWKDTAIRLEGDAVWSLTVFFLEMWEAESLENQDFNAFRPTVRPTDRAGFYQPFIDGPMNNPDNPAEIMYRSIIDKAREYVYISTPYLVIDNSMVDALCTAALGGTDVRIITPNIWDKWYVHMATQSNYEILLRAGVRIYEYTPGYIHAKTVLSDDDNCVTGSINMDYRSFYLHYENGVWMCGVPVISQIKADFLDTLEKSREITLDEWVRRPLYRKIIQGVLRVFAIFL